MHKKSLLLVLASSIVLLGFSSMFFNFPFHFMNVSNTEPVMFDLKPGDSYAADWVVVDSLERQGLPESALKLVDQIYHKAQKDQNQAQLMKCLIYTMKYTYSVQEDAIVKNVDRLTLAVDSVPFPLKPLMHSILAEHYFAYFQQNSWRFYNRSETEQVEEKDIRTWDRKKLLTAAAEHYRQSLLPVDSLRRVKLEYFEDIITKQTKSRTYRPSLYDLLAWRAFDFFRNDEVSIDQPAYKFQIEGDDFFKSDAAFVATKFDSKDSSSLLLNAVHIIQELTRQHMYDRDPSALVFVARERLSFGKQKAISDLKDSLYLQALERLEEAHRSHEVSAFLLHDIANEHLMRANKYNGAVSDNYKTEKAQALEYCNQAIERFPKADGTILCTNLRVSILSKTMTLSVEQVNAPGKPYLALLEYQNVEKVYFRAIKATKEIKDYIADYDQTQRYERLAKEPAVKSWEYALPADMDYNTHRVQVPMPDLPVGEYVILLGSDPTFKTDGEGLAFAVTHMSRIGHVDRTLPGGSIEFVVYDRETGAPLQGAECQAMERYYDYDKRKYLSRSGPKFVTDKNGFFTLEGGIDQYKDYAIDFKYKGDFLSTDDRWYLSRYRQEPARRERSTFFFTDRGIYRPGQTVYFKGIMIETDGKTSSIVANTSSTVEFYDANYQKLASLDLKTNEFGSFQGTFTAPQGQLNGQMHIQNASGSTYFSVEDYKRPKFEVTFDPIKGSFKLGEKVKVKGKAMAYAGSNIDGAEVKYRVIRTASFPWWGFWCWGRIMPTTSPMEITYGVGSTNEKGEFEIEFDAIPDRSLSADLKPQFSYQVMADVVDITGETHSSSAYVNVGYLALSANVGLASDISKDDRNKFKINAMNLNGQPEPAQGKITIHELKQPAINFRNRLWSQPDKFLMTESEFRAKFPYDIYKDENEVKTWLKGKEVYAESFDTEKNDSIDLKQCKNWPQGQYVLELNTKDKFGADIKSIQYFSITGPSDAGIPTHETLWYRAQKMTCEPGETAAFQVGTAQQETWVLYEVEHQDKIISREWMKISNGKKNFTFPITELHRGNVSMHLLAAHDGRVHTDGLTVFVPWTNKHLDIEYATFRDKLLPGANEEWTVKVKGPKGEKVAAEMLAGMYDASLDAFSSVNWAMALDPSYFSNRYWATQHGYGFVASTIVSTNWNPVGLSFDQYFDAINWFNYPIYSLSNNYFGYLDKSVSFARGGTLRSKESEDIAQTESPPAPPSAMPVMAGQSGKLAVGDASTRDEAKSENSEGLKVQGGENQKGKPMADLGDVKVRTNLNETAFFFPQLRTDSEGNVIFKFTMPEALTRWRFMTFAHTADLKTGYKEGNVVTQKELMVMPNAPRFFRENDEITYMAKVSNLSDKDLNGQATLELLDALTMKPIDVELGNTQKLQSFTVKKGQSTALSWNLKIPAGIQAVTHRVKAVAGTFSDGEESSLPVLTNSMLVTEALPLPVRPLQTKTFEFSRLINNKSTTLRNHKLTLEFTSNPAWYAVQALPYMMEYPYECTEQTFSRYYANSLASHIANKHPRIKAVFEQWKTTDKEALVSNLEKNQELKYLLLEETPWVLNAQSETERKKRVGLLFDLNKMADELERAKKKLIKSQVSNGGFTWFPGMPESRYITQHIVTGFGHLDHMGVTSVRSDKDVWNMLEKAVLYLDQRIKEDYDWLIKHGVDMKKQQIGWDHVQYLYARSYFQDINIRGGCGDAVKYYLGQAKEFWTQFNKYNQGMIALALHRGADKVTPPAIIKSLKEFSLKSDEMGMYWKGDGYGMYWYQAPIETQALLIEAFDEVANDQASVEEMKLWLLKQKQTQDWKTTKATAEACYALLLRGADYLAESKLADITIGGQKIDPLNDPSMKVEAGTGYFKTSWSGKEITPAMGKVEVKNNNKVAAWGAVYWQYFEQLDKITFAENKVSIQKVLFLEENTPTGPKITPIAKGRVLKPGDKVKVRILIETDRDMEYVHMKDMRAAGFEPINVISQYKYQDGLGYYETTRDAATNFFFDWLPKGKYVFEYPLRVTHKGDFSNGITTIQCMYAPEFTSHSEGVRVKVGG
jgi:uncharacterized protein YfaS (alpha-2-macroglobulin family)